ncbi:MAG TPA: class I SAM-dependent methyltransferase [Vicinamibacterales bacterium]|nr:class I SAM-dependent methyltransferase [Vicinamibacterales bacterium]
MTDNALASAPDIGGWLNSLLARASNLPCAFRVHTPSGGATVIGEGEPEFDLYIHNENGMRALKSLDELTIADSYVRGDLDIEGNVIKAMWLRDAIDDRQLWLKLWRRLQPLIFGREKLNPAWIAKHYDSKNIQLYLTDNVYHAYTPGIYLTDDDTLEESTERKYQFAWDSLGLREGQELLEIGCGWGGMTRFCAERGVKVTAITLSRDQLNYTRDLIQKRSLNATADYQDFFTYQPGRRFDAISCMGVIEDLSDYPRVMKRFSELLKPGARAYLDFAAGKVPFGTSSFITKYVWPGTFRMVYMPELMEAIDKSRIQLVAVYNDRRNYHLWARNGHQRWVENKARVIEESSVETYRLFRLLVMGTAGVMNNPSQQVSAYRMVLELPAD